MAAVDLTGPWVSNDGGMYYLRQLGQSMWWAGLSDANALASGLTFTNVFHGTIGEQTISGEWVDLPRGHVQGFGQLTLRMVNASILQATSQTGGFGGSTWRRVPYPSRPDIASRFNQVMRNDDGTMHDHLKMYKDHVVVFGRVVDIAALNYPSGVGRTYRDFMCNIDDGDYDGDLKFDVRIDRANLDNQPGFWTDGWRNDPANVRDKLNDGDNQQMHIEAIMYGRPAGKDQCDGHAPTLLPGWMEHGGNSVLLNGRPIDGRVALVEHPIGPERVGPAVLIAGQPVPIGTRVRVSGFLAIDCHGGDCDEDNAGNHNVELHPAYAIDLLQHFERPRSNATLTGVWHADDIGTYYLRQVEETIWWLGVSRDAGQTFANIFHGTIQNETISGEWVDVPMGPTGFRNAGTLSITGDGQGRGSTVLRGDQLGFGRGRWIKLYE